MNVKTLKAQIRKAYRRTKERKQHKLYVSKRNRGRLGVSHLTLKARNRSYGNHSRSRIEDNRFIGYEKVTAPERLSIMSNPVETINFINRLEKLLQKKRKVNVLLHNVKELGNGAILTLLSIMIKFKQANIPFNGTRPNNSRIANHLHNSGFYDILFDKNKVLQNSEKVELKMDRIVTYADKKVDTVLGSRIIKEISKNIWGTSKRSPGTKQVLLELMLNTNNHASMENKGEHHWWMTVNHNRDKNKACFAFIDYGVGIIESLTTNPKGKLYDTFQKFSSIFRKSDKEPLPNNEILRYLLNGNIHGLKEYGISASSTGRYFRGKGLPMVYDHYLNNKISRLVIITNNVYVDCDKNEYRLLNCKFSGTFIYWELSSNNEYLDTIDYENINS